MHVTLITDQDNYNITSENKLIAGLKSNNHTSATIKRKQNLANYFVKYV